MTDNEARHLTYLSLKNDLINFLDNYMIIYDRFYDKETGKNEREEMYRIKELADGLIGIFAIFDVYAKDKYIHPDYALEKINKTKSYVDSFKTYYDLWKQETGDVDLQE